MSIQFSKLYRVLCLVVVAQAAHASHVSQDAGSKVRPSDCRGRDADSTCATAVVGAPVAAPPPFIPDKVLYDGPLGGVPVLGYAYWGWDFFAEESGFPSIVRQDQFINRSNVPVTISLSFRLPARRPCARDCLPAVQFQVDAGWFKLDPPPVASGDTVSITQTFDPGRGFGWVVALWQSTNPRLTVTVPKGATATLQEVGMPSLPAIANPIAAVTGTCDCWDGSTATCSDGSRFSNGLLGIWSQNFTNYLRAGAFNSCPDER